MSTSTPSILVKRLGTADYEATWQAMSAFTQNRTDQSQDELWVVEHPPVFTQGQAGKPEHVIDLGDIPMVQVDRGGQVTYHGPGQLVIYPLINLKRLKLGVRDMVTAIEQSIVELLAQYDIKAYPKADAPGVYVDGNKIASLGLKIRKGCAFHGLALNVNMDLMPFLRINPCGYAGLQMTQSSAIGGPKTVAEAADKLIPLLLKNLGINSAKFQGSTVNE